MENILKAGAIVPAASTWSFTVLIAIKNDGKPTFCIDYRTLNPVIKPGRWRHPRIEEIFDELEGRQFFITLVLFSGY